VRKAVALAAGGTLAVAAAIAAADIPARYVGPFPSTLLSTSITGVFAGKTLMLKYTFRAGLRFIPTTANYTCIVARQNRTDCTGRFETDDGQRAGPSSVQITWKAGQPVKLHFGKKM